MGKEFTGPSGRVIRFRLPELADVEAVGFGGDGDTEEAEGLRLLDRIIVSYDGVKATADRPVELLNKDKVSLWAWLIDAVLWPTSEQLIAIRRSMVEDPVAQTVDATLHTGRVVTLRPPPARLVIQARSNGAVGMASDLHLLKLLIVAIDGEAVSQVDLRSDWPFGLKESMGLHVALTHLLAPTPTEQAAAVGSVRDVPLNG